MGKRYLADKDHTHTAADVGAILDSLPLITDANTSIADSNPTGIKIERWSKTTLNTPYTQGLTTRSDGVVITSVIKGSFATQIAFPIGGRGLYIRPNIVGSIYAWSEYGDFKSDGSVAMTGTVLNMSNGEGSFENNGIDASIRVRSVANDDSNSTSLVLDNSFSTSPYRKLYLRDTVNGSHTDYKLYGEHNKPTASDVGAYPESGSISGISSYPTKAGCYRLTGTSVFANMTPDSPYGMLQIHNAGYGLHLYISAYGTLYYGYASASDGVGEPKTWKSAGGGKPTGSYTGNGSTTQRSINVPNARGQILFVYSYDNETFAMVTKTGAFGRNASGSLVALKLSKARFSQGDSHCTMVLNTADDFLNANGVSYTYEVI